jgi:serine/threonine protein kinase
MTTIVTVSDDPVVERARTRVGLVLQEKWRLDNLLGVGGMAAVYAATHRNQKRVAVKMLHPELCNDVDIRTRFLREGYAANAIGHDGAVSVLDDDLAPDGSAFLVMELLEGETVEQRWERLGQRLPIREVLIIGVQLLDVLAVAHEKSIVHRDIKPDNLFLTRAGTLKVLDFGIARVFETQKKSTQTRQGVVMGTPAYMAPEQARARWDEVDGRTDIWAAGATMFTLLSGVHVHEALTGNEQLIYSATVPARSLASVVEGVPRSVVAAIDRALQFDRNNRWPDARAMQEALRASLAEIASGDGRSIVSMRLSIPGIDAPPVSGAAPTVMIGDGPNTQVLDWGKERDTFSGEVERLRPLVASLQPRATSARRTVEETKAKLDGVRAERRQLEQWFNRQVGNRTAAVDEARRAVRHELSALARVAMAAPAVYGAEIDDDARQEITTLERAAKAREREVALHEMAMRAYHRDSFRKGVLLSAIAAFLLFALIATPIVLRATLPAPPPVLNTPSGR